MTPIVPVSTTSNDDDASSEYQLNLTSILPDSSTSTNAFTTTATNTTTTNTTKINTTSRTGNDYGKRRAAVILQINSNISSNSSNSNSNKNNGTKT